MRAASIHSSTGPANFVVVDPDGNPVLIDQHVSSEPRTMYQHVEQFAQGLTAPGRQRIDPRSIANDTSASARSAP